MKFRLTLLLAFFMLSISLSMNEATAAERQAFTPPLTEEHMLAWLKEQGYEVEKSDTNFYAISWQQELPDGQLEAVYYDNSGCKVLIESVNGKNTAHFTFSVRLNVDIDVVVSSEVERVKYWSSPEKEQYHYYIKNLATSGRPVHTFIVDCPRRWGGYKDGISSSTEHPSYPYKGGVPNLREITNPSELWSNWERPSRTVTSLKSVVWENKGVGIIAGKSQYGFAFDSVDPIWYTPVLTEDVKDKLKGLYQSLPGIITARVDVDRSSSPLEPTVHVNGQVTNPENLPGYKNTLLFSLLHGSAVQIDGKTVDLNSERTVEKILFQICPQGKVVGPEAISKKLGILKLTQRLKTLTSQSAAEGWLDESAARQLNQHLVAALQDGRQIQVEEAVAKFRYELEQMQKEINLSNPPLTQEAATLLGTNAAYLLTKFERVSIPLNDKKE